MIIINLDFIIMIFFLYDELCKDKENKMWFLNIFFEKRIKELLLYKKMFLRCKSKMVEFIWKMKFCCFELNLFFRIKFNFVIYNMV